jgi:antitoxin ParD1/3/4
MGIVEQITVGIPRDMVEAIDAAVTAGDFAKPDDVIMAALTLWQFSRREPMLSDEELGAAWDKGISSGPGRFSSMEELLAEAHGRAKLKQS